MVARATMVAEVGSRDAGRAAEYFAETWRIHGTAEANAMKYLRMIYHAANPAPGPTFDSWLDSLKLMLPRADAVEPVTRAAHIATRLRCRRAQASAGAGRARLAARRRNQ